MKNDGKIKLACTVKWSLISNVSKHFRDLKKSYQTKQKTVKAFAKTNLNIQVGELYGLIGPDETGKLTLFSIIDNATFTLIVELPP